MNVSLGCLDCHAHTTLCHRYSVTSLPAVLIFTPSTLDTPSPPPSVGVLDSTHFLQALGQSREQPDELVSNVSTHPVTAMIGCLDGSHSRLTSRSPEEQADHTPCTVVRW